MLIQHLRDRSEGVFAKILVGLIIIVFALFGFGSITTYLAPVPKVAVVNGDEITQQEMELAVERNRQYLLSQDVDPLDINEDQLRDNVLQTLITRKLLTQAVEDMNLQFSEARLEKEIVDTPVFQINNVFDSEQFQVVIRSSGFTPMSYRAEMRSDKLLGQLSSAIQSTAFVTDSMIRRAGSLSGQTRDIAFLRLDLESLLSEVNVTSEELRSYYDANLQSYETEETVDIGYVELKLADIIDEVEVTEAALASYYAEHRASYSIPESRRVAHILIESGEDSDDSDREAAKQKAREIHQQLMSGGDFSELAKEHSDDPGSAANGGDLGFSERGIFDPDFEVVAFELDLEQISEPVLTKDGYHIIKLLELEEGHEPELEEVRETVENTYRESLAEDLFISRSNRLSELAFESADLQEPAAELGLQIKSTGHVSRKATEGIAGDLQVIDAVFSGDLLLDGNNSDIIEISQTQHVVVRVNSHELGKLQSFEEVKESIRETQIRDKASELAESSAREMVAMLESGSVTRFVADQYGLEWQVFSSADRTQTDLDPDIRNHAFTLPRPVEGDKSIGYTSLPDGDVVVISVTNVVNRAESDLIATEMTGIGDFLISQQGFLDFQEFQDNLSGTSDIERTQ